MDYPLFPCACQRNCSGHGRGKCKQCPEGQCYYCAIAVCDTCSITIYFESNRQERACWTCFGLRYPSAPIPPR